MQGAHVVHCDTLVQTKTRYPMWTFRGVYESASSTYSGLFSVCSFSFSNSIGVAWFCQRELLFTDFSVSI